MNQILQTKLINNKKLLFFLKFQLILSIIFIVFLCLYFLFMKITISQKENFSKEILDNYSITKLYSDSNNFSYKNQFSSNVIGIISIPKINIYYPIFSSCTEELLRISPCRFYGSFPGKKGNLCIAGHNYDNGKFFSNIPSLKVNDEIILSDNYSRHYSYFITQIYEVKKDNLNPIYNFDKNLKNLTLITCNNISKNRIIVRAVMK